jgi:hypothetical protein
MLFGAVSGLCRSSWERRKCPFMVDRRRVCGGYRGKTQRLRIVRLCIGGRLFS